MFVEGVFYNDQRHVGWRDQSESVRKFLALSGEGDEPHVPARVLGRLDVGIGEPGMWRWVYGMERVRLRELWVRQGLGTYLYCH